MIDYSVFTSGAYRATAPNAAFPQDRGPRQASLLGWKKSRTSLPCPIQSRSENALSTNGKCLLVLALIGLVLEPDGIAPQGFCGRVLWTSTSPRVSPQVCHL